MQKLDQMFNISWSKALVVRRIIPLNDIGAWC